MNDVTNRRKVFESIDENPMQWKDEAREKRMSVSKLALSKSVKENEWEMDNITDDYLAKKGFRCYATDDFESSSMEELDTKAKKIMFMDKCDQVFKKRFNNIGNPKRKSAITALAPGGMFRPYEDIDNTVSPLMADIPLADIIGETRTTRTLVGRIGQYQMPKTAEEMVEIAEGTAPPEFTMKTGERTVEMKKAGVILRTTGEFMQLGETAQTVLTWTERVGVRIEIALSNQALALVSTNAPVGNATARDVSSPDHILEMQASFNNGQVADRVVGLKAPALKYYAAARRDASAIPGGAVEVVAMPRLGNRISRPEYVFYTDDAAAGFTANTLYWFDSRNSLGILTYAPGDYDETDRDILANVERRVMTTWYGLFTQDDAPLVKYTIT